jgi:PsbP-like protein
MRKLTPGFFIMVVIGVIVARLVARYDDFLPYRWQTFTAQDRSFSIEFPDKPIEDTSQISTESGGTAVLHQVSAKPNVHSVFSCIYTNRENPEKNTPDQALHLALEGSMRNVQGTVLSQKEITVQGNPGLEIRASARNNSNMDARIIVVGSRLYMIMIVDTEKPNDAKAVQRVFQSFKLS